MRLTRVHCPLALAAGTEVVLPEAASEHVRRVLRLRVGDEILVFDGQGMEFGAGIASVAGGTVRVRLAGQVTAMPESSLAVTLVQGVSRGERMDLTLQKATELGVRAIVPVLTSRSVVRLDARQAAAKLRHWQAVVISACEQCGRSRLPELHAAQSWPGYLTRHATAATRLLLDPEADAELASLVDPGTSVDLLVGPEGGLDETERAAAGAAGFRAVRIGPRVLRTETAGIAALAVLQSRWGDLR